MSNQLPSITVEPSGVVGTYQVPTSPVYGTLLLSNQCAFPVTITQAQGAGTYLIASGQSQLIKWGTVSNTFTYQGVNNTGSGTVLVVGYQLGDVVPTPGPIGTIFDLSGQTVNISSNEPLDVSGTVSLSSGTTVSIDSTQPVQVSGEVTLPSGTVVSIDTTVPLNITGTIDLASGTEVTINPTSTVDVTGTVDLASGATVVVDSSTPVDITGSVAISSGTLDANITNATLEITTNPSSPPVVDVANAVLVNINSSENNVTVANEVSTSITASKIVLDTTAKVSNTLLGTNPIQPLGVYKIVSATYNAGKTVDYKFDENASAMLCDEIWISVAASTNPITSYSFTLLDLAYWPINSFTNPLNQSFVTVTTNGLLGVYKLPIQAFLLNGFSFSITNTTNVALTDSFVVTAWGRFASNQSGVLLPPGSPVSYSTTLASSGTLYQVCPANIGRAVLLVWNSSGQDLSIQFSTNGGSYQLIPNQGLSFTASELPFITYPVYASGTVDNQAITIDSWEI